MKIKIKLFVKKYYAELIGLFVFFIYFSTTSRTLGESDSGELAAVQAVWGIAHPTGYPLFTLIGYLFSQIPLPITTIFKLNLLNVIWNSLTVIFIIKIIHHILGKINLFITEKDKLKLNWLQISDNGIIIISVLSGLSFAFSVTFWTQAVKIEVYSLQLFLTSIIIYLSLKQVFKDSADDNEPKKAFKKNWILVSVFFGLAFSNHLMTLYLIPALLYLFFKDNSFNKRSIAVFLTLCLITFSIAFLFYLTMVFRAQSNPSYMFNNTSTFPVLIDHILAKEYNRYIFEDLETVEKQSGEFFKVLSFEGKDFDSGEFSFMLIFAFTGIIFSAIFFKRLFTFVILLIITSLFFAFNYSIPDINEYFLVVFFCFAISISVSLLVLFSFLKKTKHRILLSLIVCTLVSYQLIINFKHLDRSKDFFIEDYPKELLNSLPKDSYLVSHNWDYVTSPSLYLQNVNNVRPDIEVITLHLLFKKEYKKELKQKFRSFKEFLANDYYITYDILDVLIRKEIFNPGPDAFIIPDVLTYKVVHNKDKYYPAGDPDFKVRFRNERTENEDYYYTLIAWTLENRAKYEIDFNKPERAKIYLNKIKSDFPDYEISSDLAELITD